MGDKFFPDVKEPHIHDYGTGIDFDVWEVRGVLVPAAPTNRIR